MGDTNDSVLDKAESFARRVLERLGAKVDSKIGAREQQTLTPREVGELTSRIERVIEASLREDQKGSKRVAPHRFKILFTYEETNRLNTQYIEALGNELKATIYEYINNRRYETGGPVEVETGRDLFAKITSIKASFEGDAETDRVQPSAAGKSPARQNYESRKVELRGPDGRAYRFDLRADGGPVYIGRVAGNAVRIDDPSISRLHCSLALRANGDVVVSDLGSSNGTSINGQALSVNQARPVSVGDRIQVGDVSLSVSDIS